MSHGYRCPSDERLLLTNYIAVTGPRTLFAAGQAASREDMRDGAGETIIIVESPGHPVHWMAPVDVSADEFCRLLTAATEDRLPHSGGVYVLLGDGTVRFLSRKTPERTLRALITIAGGDSPGRF